MILLQAYVKGMTINHKQTIKSTCRKLVIIKQCMLTLVLTNNYKEYYTKNCKKNNTFTLLKLLKQ